MFLRKPGGLIPGISIALGFSAGVAQAADHFQMLPSDTEPFVIAPFQMLESDIAAATANTIYNGNSSAGSASLETGPNEAIIFRDNATASSASIVNNGGQTHFEDNSTAQAASLTANEQGYVRFSGSAIGADSRIVINEGGRVDFDGNAQAGSAFITDNGYLRFSGNASADNAEITVNEDGVLAFRESSGAGIARIANNGLTGFFDSSTLAGSIITNNGGATVYFADDANAGTTSFIGNSGTVVFADRSTLGTGAITNNATGILRFEDMSSAGAGFISSGGGVVFTDRSSAASARIIGNVGGLILFRDDSTAAGASISGDADLRFSGRATAGSASIGMGPGTTLSFIEDADGASARVQLDSGSVMDIAAANGSIGVGSISGAGRIALGANTLAFGDATPLVDFAGNIADAGLGGGLVKRGSGTVNLSGRSTYTGATRVQAGRLEAGADNVFAPRSAFTVGPGAALALAGFDQEIGSLAGSGLVDLSAGSQLTTGGNGRSTTFAGSLAGSGGLTKIGAGEFALTGASSYSGDTIVSQGRLRVDGDVSASSVTVDRGATLLGTGRVGTAQVAGTLLGEANGGTLTIAGDLTLSNSATTALAISGVQSGRFSVAGTASLAGAFSVLPSASVIPNRQYVFLTGGLVTGSYTSIRSNFAFLDPVLTYGPTFAAFELERNAVPFSGVGQTPNQRAAATAIEALGAGNAVYDAVLPLSTDAARAGFDNLSGEGHAVALLGASTTQGMIRRAVFDQTANDTRAHVWGIAQGAISDLSSDGNGADASFDTISFIGGTDLISGGDLQAGLFGYLGYTDLSLGARATDGNMQYGGAGIYGGWNISRWRLRGVAALAYNTYDLERHISAGTLSGITHSDYDGWTASAAAEVGYNIEVGNLGLEPYLGLDYGYSRTDGFAENGAGAANLSSDGSSYSRLDWELGVRATASYRLQNGVLLQPGIGLAYVRNLSGDTATSTQAFAGGENFTVSAARPGRDSAAIDFRINIAFTNSIEGDISYRGFLSENEYNQLFGAGFRIAF